MPDYVDLTDKKRPGFADLATRTQIPRRHLWIFSKLPSSFPRVAPRILESRNFRTNRPKNLQTGTSLASVTGPSRTFRRARANNPSALRFERLGRSLLFCCRIPQTAICPRIKIRKRTHVRTWLPVSSPAGETRSYPPDTERGAPIRN